MALYVDYTEKGKSETFCWHIGERMAAVPVQGVWFLQADGDELERIRSRFPALVPAGVRVAQFPAPFAGLMYSNLA
jgi:hypothetical protein